MRERTDYAGGARRKAGTSPSYVNRLVKSPEKIINNTFVKMMEKLGYDIELTYVKR